MFNFPFVLDTVQRGAAPSDSTRMGTQQGRQLETS